MKVAIVIFVIGEEYERKFEKFFKQNVQYYCQKYDYDLIILNECIKHEPNMDKKKFYWQRMLIPNKFQEYDYVVSLDSDIYINPEAPPLPLEEIPEGKVGAVNERKYMNNYEWREMVQLRMGWERTGKEWHALSGESRDYHDHINGGLVIYQPKYHAECFKDLYEDNISSYMKYHQDDQSILSLYLIDNNIVHWLDERFNKIWIFHREIFYPNFYSLYEDTCRLYVKNFLGLNYFCHFCGGVDIEYIL